MVAAVTPAEGRGGLGGTCFTASFDAAVAGAAAGVGAGVGVGAGEGVRHGVRTWGEETIPVCDIPMARRSALGRTWYSKVSSVSRVTWKGARTPEGKG